MRIAPHISFLEVGQFRTLLVFVVSTLFFLSLSTGTVYAAIGTGGATCTNQVNVASTTIGCTVATEAIEVGNVAVLWFGGDNLDNGGNGKLISGVTDTGGNSWVVQRCFSSSLAAAAGATVCVATSKITTQLNVGATILTTHGSITAKAVVVKEFTVGTGNGLVISGAPQDQAQATDPGLMTLSGLTSADYLFIRATALERNATTWTPTASYTTSGCNTTAGGGAAANNGVCGEFRIITATTSSASDPTGTAVDNASVYFAMQEASTTLSGTLYSDEGGTTINSGKVIKIAVGGVYMGTTSTNGSGVWSFVSPTLLATATVITIFVDGDATTRAALVTIAASSSPSISGLDLYKNRVIVRHEGTTAITNTHLSFYDDDNDSDIQYTSNGGTLTVRTGNELHIYTGKTFAPGGAVTINGNASSTDPLDGTFHLPDTSVYIQGGDTTIAGSFNASSTTTFTSSTYTLLFTATTTGKSINAPLYSLGNVTMGNTQMVAFGTNATTTNFTIDSAATVTAPASTLAVFGNYANNGTFLNNNATVFFPVGLGSSATGTLSGSSAFNNIVLASDGSTRNFTNTGGASGSYQISTIIDSVNRVLYIGSGATGLLYRCELSTACDASGDFTSIDFAESYILSLVIDATNGVLYAGGSDTGTIYRCLLSTACDALGDFTTAYDTPESGIQSFGIDATNGVLYAGSNAGGIIYRCLLSTACDAAGDFTTAYDTPGQYIMSFAFDYTNAVMYVGNGQQGIIYRCLLSTACDASGDFTTAYDTPGTYIASIVVDSANGVLYAGTYGGGIDDIYRCLLSTACDASGDFTSVYSKLMEVNELLIDPIAGVLYAAMDIGLYKCSLFSSCDTASDFNVTYTNQFLSMAIDSTNKDFYGTNGTVTKGKIDTFTFSTNASTTNFTINSGATVVAPSQLSVSGNYVNNGTYKGIDVGADYSWTARAASEASSWRSVAYGNGTYVAVAEAGTNRVMTSPDGITWTSRSASEANSWRSVTYGVPTGTTTGIFVAVAILGTNRVMTSPDGITWTARAAVQANSWNSVTFGLASGTTTPLFVAVSYDGTNCLMTSPDGINWTARTPGLVAAWRSVTYGNGMFVAVSYSGASQVMKSSDGVTWTSHSASEANGWYSVTYGAGLFVAVAQNGTNRVMSSPDGSTWTARAASIANSWESVTFGNGLFVAVSSLGSTQVMSSLDGITWTSRTGAEVNAWWHVSYWNNQFVAVSIDGTNRVMTSVGLFSTNSTTSFTGTSAQTLSGIMTATSSFDKVIFSGTGTKTFVNNASTSNFTVNTGATVVAPAQLSISGNYTNSSTFTPGSGTTTFNGTSAQTLIGTSTFNNVEINTGATVVAPAQLTLSGNYTNSGTFTAGTGTTTFNGTSAQTATGTLTAASSFNNVVVTNSSASTTFAAPLTVNGNFNAITPGTILVFQANATSTFASTTIAGSSGNKIKLRSTTGGTQFGFDVNATTSSSFSNIDVQDSNACDGNGGDLTATGGTDSGNNLCWTLGLPSITITTNTQWGSGTYNYDSITVTNNATLTLLSSTTGSGLTATGTGVIINAQNITVDAGSAISADGKGFAGSATGNGPGAPASCPSWGSGGGYGGNGGYTYGGATYGSYIQPIDLGSGGCAGTGGNGGGAIKLIISDTFTNNGTTTASGANSGNNIGAGSGGSIWVDAGTITGTGSFRANGGNTSSGWIGGSGGGGRIALWYNINNYIGTTTAYGGTLSSVGGAGTVYQKNKTAATSSLVVIGSTGGNTRITPEATTTTQFFTMGNNITSIATTSVISSFSTIIVTNGGKLTLNASSTIIVPLIVTGTSTVTFSPGTSTLTTLALSTSSQLIANSSTTGTGLTATGYGVTINAANITVDAGSSISADGKGFTSSASGNGPGAPASCPSWGSGGGYGGKGGYTYGGATYGSYTQPVDLGSGGCYGAGGDGGGAIKLVVSGTFTNNGTTTARGSNGGNNIGGGSGGSIWIDAGTITGTGAIKADGGNTAGCCIGGSGGGGRIALYYTTNTYTGTTTAYGGTVYSPGGAGTIYMNGINDFNLSGSLYSDEGITLSTTTSKTIGIAVGTSTVSVQSVTTDASGTWYTSFPQGHTIGTSTPILVYVDGDVTTRAALVTKALGTADISGLNLYQNRVIISHEGTSGTSTTNTDLSFYDGDNDSDIQYTSNAGTLSVRTNQELHIQTGKTFAPGGTVTINGNASSTSLTDGSFHMSANSIYTQSGTTTLAGSLTASSSAVFTRDNTPLVFNATTTGKSINVSSTTMASYGTTTFSGTSGAWTILNNATTSSLTIAAGTVVAPAQLTITGNYQNNGTSTFGTGTTTFAGTSAQTATGTMTGTSAFNHVIILNTSATTTFAAPLTVNGYFTATASGTKLAFIGSATSTFATTTITGNSSTKTTLRSTTPGTQFNIKVTGSYSFINLDIKDSNACSNGTLTATLSTSTGNNTCWSIDDGNLVITTNTQWGAGTYTYQSIIVTNNATLTLLSSTTGSGLTATGTGVTINATNITIDAGSKISADLKGFTGVASAGGNGPGGGSLGGCCTYGGAGGGYGGTGGSFNGASGGITYGSLLAPIDLGSAGGAGWTSYRGGNGGGAIKFAVSGTFTNNGVVSANGEGGSVSVIEGGGGSGGSIWVDAGTVAGSGTITANGGTSYSSGAGGAGGRIAFWYDTYSYTGTTTAAGLSGSGAGTIYEKNKITGSSTLTVNGTGNTRLIPELGVGTITIRGGNNTTFATTSVFNATTSLALLGTSTLTLSADTYTFANIILATSSQIIASSSITGSGLTSTGYGVTINATNITIDAGSKISADLKGFTGVASAGGNGPGGGSLGGCCTYGGAGGGYGGTGGSFNGASGGITYGSLLAPIDLGSAGGAGWTSYRGGNGGGAIKFAVSGTFTNNGVVSANGEGGSVSVIEGGGGSGGSIWVDAGTVAGSGTITANGGTSYSSGAGGAGGRIAFWYDTYSYTGTTTAAGLSGSGAGTIYYNSKSSLIFFGTLYSNEGITPLASSKTINIAIGTTTTSLHATTSSTTGTWSFTLPNGSTIVPSTPIAIWVDGDVSTRAAFVTKAANGIDDIVADLYQNRVIVSHEATSGTSTTNSDISFYDGDNDSDIQYTSNAGALSVRTNQELHINAGKTFTPGGVVTINGNASSTSLTDGSFHLPASSTYIQAGTTTIGGSLSTFASATFTRDNTPLVFNATTTGKTINATMATYGTTTFNGVGGAWSFVRSSATTSNLTVATGTVTMPAQLTITGNYTNSGVTTFGASTTIFNSANSQTLSGIMVASSTFNNLLFTNTGTKIFVNSASSTSLTIDTGATVVAPSTALTIGGGTSGGSFFNNGIFNANSGTVYGSGMGSIFAGTMTGSSTFNNFTAIAGSNNGAIIAYKPPAATGVLSLTLDTINGILYAGTDSGGIIYRCDTSIGCVSAANWTTSYDTPAAEVRSMFFDAAHGVLYAGTNNNLTVYRCDTSTLCDAASDWTTSYTGSGGAFESFTFDSVHSVLYASTQYNGRIYRCDTSTNCDDTSDWSQPFTASVGNVYAIIFDSVNGVLYTGGYNGGTISRCDTATGCNSSGNWTSLNPSGGNSVFSFAFDPTNAILYMGTWGSGVLRCDTSTGCAANGNWTSTFDPGNLVSSLTVDVANGILYAVGNNNIYRCYTSTGCASSGNWNLYNQLPNSVNYTTPSLIDTTHGILYAGTGYSSGGGTLYAFPNSINFTSNASTTNFTIGANATVTAPTNLSIAGNYSNSGLFRNNSGTVSLIGASQQTLSGSLASSSAFNNLKIQNTSGNGTTTRSVIFATSSQILGTFTMLASTSAQFVAGGTTTVNNMTMNGSSTAPIYLRSSSAGTPWNLVSSGIQSISYVDVKDSYACSGNTINAQNSTNVSGNTCWNFDAIGNLTFSGRIYTDEGTTELLTAGKTITLRIDTPTPSILATTTVAASGFWQINNIDATGIGIGTTISVWVDNDATFRATTVTRASTTVNNIPQLDLYQNRVIVKNEKFTASNVTNATLGVYDGDDDGDIQYTSNSNNLSLRTGNELHITPGTTYVPGGTITLNGNATTTIPDGDLHLASGLRQDGVQSGSTLTMGSNALTLAGGFIASSTSSFTHTGMTTFNSTSTASKLVIATSTALNNVTFSSGTTTFAQHAATTSNLTINTGATVVAPASNLTITGNYTNNGTFLNNTGVVWAELGAAAVNTWLSVTYGNGLFVAVSSSGSGNRVMTSPDGITWTSRSSAANSAWYGVTYGNGLFVAVACGASDTSCNATVGTRVMTSPDGITWTSRTSPTNNRWRSVTYGNGLFVAVSQDGTGDRVMTSSDGITWTVRDTSGKDSNFVSVTYGNGLFVAVAESPGNRVLRSSDGVTWATSTSAATNSWFSVTYGNGLYVAVAMSGTGNRVMTSPDGITWTSRTSASDNSWWSVTYGNGLFVAVSATTSANTAIMTSTDGITWTSRTSAANSYWYGVTYGNGLFVAVSGIGINRVMTSGSLVTLNSGSSQTLTGTMTATSTFNALSLQGSGTKTFASNASTSNLTINTGATAVAPSILSLTGDYANYGTFTHSTGTVILNAGNAQTATGTMTGTSAFNTLSLMGAGTKNFGSSASTTNITNETYSTMVAPTSTQALTIGGGTNGGLFVNNGTFNANTGTIYAAGLGTALSGTMTGSSTFNNFTAITGTNNGVSVARGVPDASSYPAFYSFTIDTTRNILYAGSGDRGIIYRCDLNTGCVTDANWTISYDTPQTDIKSLAFDAVHGVLYAGSYLNGDGGFIYRCDTTTLCDAAGDWTTSYNTAEYSIHALVVDTTHSVLYASTGSGRIYRCDTTIAGSCDDSSDWAYYANPTMGEVYSIIFDSTKGVLYIGGINNNTIYRCDTITLCDAWSDWTTSWNHGGGGYSYGFDSIHSVIYAGTGLSGVIYRCDTTTFCDAAGDWTISYDAPEQLFRSFAFDPTGGILYAGADQNGRIYRCDTATLCDTAGDWSVYYDSPDTDIYSLIFTNGALYAGSGYTNGRIYRLSNSITFVNNASTTNFTIGTNATVTAPTQLSIAGNYSNSGLFKNNNATTTFDGTSAQSITGITTGTSAFKNLVFNGSGTKTITTVASTTNLTINTGATVVAPATTLGITGNYLNNGTFTGNGGTVLMQGTATQTLSGTLTGTSAFSNLTLANTSANGSTSQSVIFAAPASTTATFTMLASTSAQFLANATSTFTNVNFGGVVNQYVYLRSSAPGTPWGLVVPGTQSITYTNVKDSQACSGNPAISAVDGTSIDAGGNTCWQFVATAATISSAAAQTFAYGSGATAISTITITDHTTPSITASNDLRIIIATTTTNMRFDTTDTTAVFGGTAAGKVSNPVSYLGNGEILVIPVDSSFSASDTLTISGLSYTAFNTLSPATVALGMRVSGVGTSTTVSDDKTVAITGTYTLDNHTLGQVDDNFADTAESQVELYAFKLTPQYETATITPLVFNISNAAGIASSDLTNLALYRDMNSDKLYDASDVAIGGGGTANIVGGFGTITFNTAIDATTTRDYLLIGDTANMAGGDTMRVSLSTPNITTSGSVSLAQMQGSGQSTISKHRRAGKSLGGGGHGEAGGEGAPQGGGQLGGGSGNGGNGMVSGNTGETLGSEPSSNAPTTNGTPLNQWTNGSDGIVSDGNYATVASGGLSQSYGSFGFFVPAENQITGIAVRFEGSGSTAAGTISARLTWDGGSSVTSLKTTGTLTTGGDLVYTLGGPSDLWGRTWTNTEFSNANFSVEFIGNPSSNTVGVDAIQVRVYHQFVDPGTGGGGGAGEVSIPSKMHYANLYTAIGAVWEQWMEKVRKWLFE